MAAASPSLEFERALACDYHLALVAGLDEAGRGALAGPVYAAAVCLPLEEPRGLGGVTDSKLLSPAAREALCLPIVEVAVTHGVGMATAAEIDEQGIAAATRLAMRRSLDQLSPPADGLLIDGRIRLKSVNLPQRSLVRGDQLSLSIAAASILAKVARDRHMVTLAQEYPAYGFDQHKGYGTELHRQRLAALGPCPEHRRSFGPLRWRLLEAGPKLDNESAGRRD